MNDLDELVHEWAIRNCPDLLDDEALVRSLRLFVLELIDYSLLAARRQVYREMANAKVN